MSDCNCHDELLQLNEHIHTMRTEIANAHSEVIKIQYEQAQKIVALQTEMANWRWGLLVCFGMVLASICQLILAQFHLSLPPIIQFRY